MIKITISLNKKEFLYFLLLSLRFFFHLLIWRRTNQLCRLNLIKNDLKLLIIFMELLCFIRLNWRHLKEHEIKRRIVVLCGVVRSKDEAHTPIPHVPLDLSSDDHRRQPLVRVPPEARRRTTQGATSTPHSRLGLRCSRAAAAFSRTPPPSLSTYRLKACGIAFFIFCLAQVEEVEQRKHDLLRAVQDTQRGLVATPEQRSIIEEALVI